MNYTVGKTLCFEFGEHGTRKGQCQIVTITKVGRRWLELSNGFRVDAGTLIADGGAYTPPGRCFLSREDRDEDRARKRAWANLRDKMPWIAPDGLSAATIEQAARLLGLNKEEPK